MLKNCRDRRPRLSAKQNGYIRLSQGRRTFNTMLANEVYVMIKTIIPVYCIGSSLRTPFSEDQSQLSQPTMSGL